MQGFSLLLEAGCPAYLRQETDTAHPRTLLPIYYIHTLSSPFCGNPLCACHQGIRDVIRLFGIITEGTLLLADAVALTDERSEAAMSNAAGIDQPTRTVLQVDLIPGVPEDCQLYGHTWQQSEHPGVKECVLCHIRGYCPGCTPVSPAGAQPFPCTRHTPRSEVQR